MNPALKPTAGRVYVSATDPKMRIYIERVHELEGDEEDPPGYYVEACADGDQDDMGAPGIEMNDDEWEEMQARHGLTPSP